MKKIIMGLLCLLFVGQSVYSQCVPALPTTVLNKDWKWWILNPNDPDYLKTWSYQYQTNCKLVLCPWLESVSTKLVNIIATNDFLPANGWELLDKNLGASISVGKFPYFVLYNRNSGILRVFAYNRTLDGKSAKSVGVSLAMVPKQSPLSKRETSLISMYEPAASSAQYYQDNTVIKNTSATVLSEVRSDEAWVVVDFNMGFEPNTDASVFNDNFITIDLVSIEEATISLQGSMVGTTTSYNDFKGSLALPGTLEDIYNDMDVAGLTTNSTVNGVAAKKIDLSSLQDNLSKYKDKLSNLEKAEDNVINISKKSGEIIDKYLRDGVGINQYVDGAILATAMKTYNVTKEGSGFRKFASTVSNVAKFGGPILEFAGTIVGFLASKEDVEQPIVNKQVFTPTISRSYLKLTGTITSTLAKQRISLIVPGSNISTGSYNQSFIDLNSSLYNCPLGIYTLKKTPTVNVQSYKAPLDNYYGSESTVCYLRPTPYGNVAGCEPTTGGYSAPPVYYNMKRVTINNSIEQILNTSSGMELVDTKVALAVKYKVVSSYDNITYRSVTTKFNDDYVGDFDYRDNSGLGVYGKIRKRGINFFYNRILMGELEIAKFDGTNTDPDITLRTPYVSLSCMQGLYIDVPEEYEVVLRVFAVLKKKGTDSENTTPFVFLKDYSLKSTSLSTINNMAASELSLVESQTVSSLNFYPNQSPSFSGLNTRDVIVESEQTVNSITLSSFGTVILKPGTKIKSGKEFRAYITPKYILPLCTTIVPTPVYTTSTLCQSSIKYNNNSYRIGDEEQSSIQQIKDLQNHIIHPNPVTSGNLNFGRKVNNYTLMNSTGAVMQQGTNAEKLDVTGLSKGLYMLKLDGKIEKVIVE
jgi:hypothetical protein